MPRRSGASLRGPARKSSFFRRKQARNTYRRRSQREWSKLWLRLSAVCLGFLGLAGLSLGLLLLYYQLLTCGWFCIKDIHHIDIDGARRLTPELILSQAHLAPGMNLLALRPARHEQALLSHPWIARAELTRKWPNRLLVHIQEREPAALVQLGELYYVDRQGRLFKPLSPGDPHDFPIITGLVRDDFSLHPQQASTTLTRVFQLLDMLKQTPPPLNLENISEVHVDHERGFTLYANGLLSAVVLGRDELSVKLDKFARLWPVLQQKGYHSRVKCINLDYPQRVLLTLAGIKEK